VKLYISGPKQRARTAVLRLCTVLWLMVMAKSYSTKSTDTSKSSSIRTSYYVLLHQNRTSAGVTISLSTLPTFRVSIVIVSKCVRIGGRGDPQLTT